MHPLSGTEGISFYGAVHLYSIIITAARYFILLKGGWGLTVKGFKRLPGYDAMIMKGCLVSFLDWLSTAVWGLHVRDLMGYDAQIWPSGDCVLGT